MKQDTDEERALIIVNSIFTAFAHFELETEHCRRAVIRRLADTGISNQTHELLVKALDSFRED